MVRNALLNTDMTQQKAYGRNTGLQTFFFQIGYICPNRISSTEACREVDTGLLTLA